MSTAIDVIGWTLVHFVWEGTLIGLVTAIVLASMARASSQTRYAVACLAMASMLAAPLATAYRLSALEAAGDRLSVADAGVPASTSPLTVHPAPTATPPPATPQARAIDTLLIVVCAWTMGVCVSVLRLLCGWWRIRRLHRTGLRGAVSSLQPLVDRLARGIGLSFVVRVVDTALVDTPSVIGWLRPVILLPVAALASLTPAQVEAILAHELAHIRRRDYLINVLQTLAEALLFFHPAVWWVSRRIRTEREHCCDDMAVALCGDALGYAKALAHLASFQQTDSAPLVTAASGGELLCRIKRLVDRAHNRPQPRANAGALALVALLLVVVGGVVQRATAGAEASAGAKAPARRGAPVAGRTLQGPPESTQVVTTSAYRLVPPPPSPPPPPPPSPQGAGRQRDFAYEATPLFDLYFVPELRDSIDRVRRQAEEAYARVSGDLKHDLATRPALLLVPTAGEVPPTDVTARTSGTEPALRIVIANDLPASRLPGQLRHELTHVFAFDILPNAIVLPAWVREGLAEFERGEPDPASLEALRALAARDALPRISRVTEAAFPTNPQLDTTLGLQAFAFMESRWGWNGIRQFLFAARINHGLADAYARALGISADDFDRGVIEFVRATSNAAQTPAATVASAAAPAYQFEHVVLRRHEPGTPQPVGGSPAGNVRFSGFTLRQMIRSAYGVPPYQDIAGGPDWLDTTLFDFTAAIPEDLLHDAARQTGKQQYPLPISAMLKHVLEDRFHLQTHRESRQAPVYALVVAGEDGVPGPRLLRSNDSCGLLPLNGPIECGVVMRIDSIVGNSVPISALARVLERRLAQPVVDRTGLRDDYSFTVEFGPPSTGRVIPANGRLTSFDAPRDPSALPLVKALESQLGLKLEPQRGPVDVLVIDEAALPLDD
jgi:uncharacterized protein (TIGR03435 family)